MGIPIGFLGAIISQDNMVFGLLVTNWGAFCIGIPGLYFEIICAFDKLRQRDEENQFKKMEIPQFLRPIIYCYDKIKYDAYIVVVVAQLLLVFSVIAYGIFSILFISDLIIPIINVDSRIYVITITIFLSFHLFTALFIKIIYIIAFRDMYAIDKNDFNIVKHVRDVKENRKKDREMEKIVDRINLNCSVKKELERFCVHKYKGIYHIYKSDIKEIEKILSDKYPKTFIKVEAEKKKEFLSVYDEEDGILIYRAPVKNK